MRVHGFARIAQSFRHLLGFLLFSWGILELSTLDTSLFSVPGALNPYLEGCTALSLATGA